MKACRALVQELGTTRSPRAKTSPKNKNFGLHLTLDGYLCNSKKLDDPKWLMYILEDLPRRMRMHLLMPPYVVHAGANDKKDPGGWSGCVVIEESHIAIHTFPGRGFVSADVYTCKNGMDVAFIENYFRQKFALGDIETNFIKRGTRYPTENLD